MKARRAPSLPSVSFLGIAVCSVRHDHISGGKHALPGTARIISGASDGEIKFITVDCSAMMVMLLMLT